MEQIKIIAAAVKIDKMIVSLPRPARHHDILKFLDQKLGYFVPSPDDQGFLDSNGEFRERWQARVIARDAGQLLSNAQDHADLYSEDVW